MAYSATDLRRDIYRILDRVLETGEAVEIERNGRRLRLSAVSDEPATQRLRPLPDLIAGDPAELAHIDWSGEWKA